MRNSLLQVYVILLVLISCRESSTDSVKETASSEPPLFESLSPQITGVDFVNRLEEGPNLNVLMYEYLYNGGGVAAADFNGDDLIDLYFTSNLGENKCYLNLGDFKFKEITDIAGIGGRPGPWKTGVTAADVNGDGLIDIYACYSGALPPRKRINQLFINQGNDENGVPIFKEEAAAYGLDSPAFSNQGYFLDYDRDGDLDMLLLNHNPKSLPVLNVSSTKKVLEVDDPLQGIRLYRQDEGRFTDVTIKAGISGSALTYGLGIGIGDFNLDGWQDFYVSNDYAVPDYLYINQGDGTFSNELQQQIGHTSHFSMGNNVADINNDGLQDIFTLDMLPEDNKRQKLLLAPDNYDKFDLNVESGFHYQYMRNMLQLNNGNQSFTEIGQWAGLSNTDWSWAALWADYNNDGWKDLFITNGYYRDYTNLDFIDYMEDFVQQKGRLKRQDVLELIQQMPSTALSNYLFTAENGTGYTDRTTEFGLAEPANSNGAAYADLDNDGDLDLVVNNINAPAFVYRNNARNSNRHYLKIKLEGMDKNSQGLGANVIIYQNNRLQSVWQMPSRGYLSSVSPILHFGLGGVSKIDSLRIKWNSGKEQLLTAVNADQMLTLKETEAIEQVSSPVSAEVVFEAIDSPFIYESSPSAFNDFKRQSLLVAQLSHTSPLMLTGDFNEDGRSDIFIGGPYGEQASVYFRERNGTFRKGKVGDFEEDAAAHDQSAAIFDANGDGHLDIYVGSGGYHDLAAQDVRLQDRLYLGDGSGRFSKEKDALPELRSCSGTVEAGDYDSDGDLDLFIGGNTIPGAFPESSKSFILQNDGQGNFKDVTSLIAPSLQKIDLVTDAEWIDSDADGDLDLWVVGQWMPVTFFRNESGKFTDQTSEHLEAHYSGLWNSITTADLNADGRQDFILGNLGTNTQIRASIKEPATLVYDDFDNNGSTDPILNFYIQGKSFPFLTRNELLGQLAYLRSRFTTYEGFAEATLEEIFTEEALSKANKKEVTYLQSAVLMSKSDGGYTLEPLPAEAQFSMISEVLCDDFDRDGNKDLLLFGNNAFMKLRLGRLDANRGMLLHGNGEGKFEYIPQVQSGLNISGDVKSVLRFNDTLLIGIYGAPVKAIRF